MIVIFKSIMLRHVVACTVAAALIAGLVNGQCGTCTMTTGHSVTLDGGEHHYLGLGWARIWQIDQLELQCLYGACHGVKTEQLSGFKLRNADKKICLQACRLKFDPPGHKKCEFIASWEPNTFDENNVVSVDVNGVFVPQGKGHEVVKSGGNATETSWSMRVERVGNDGVAIDLMLAGSGVVAVRLGPSHIISVTVKDVEGGGGLCGSCDGDRRNDLAGALSLNISDIEGHDRFASSHIRGAPDFVLIPARPVCVGGKKIDDKQEVADLIKDRDDADAAMASLRLRQSQLQSLGSSERLPGDPDTDPAMILPPVAMFSNETVMDAVEHDCIAGMIIPDPGSDTRMQFAIDNCVLEKSYGPGFEVWATNSILAYVHGLVVGEQTSKALDLYRQGAGPFCAMCVNDVQTLIVDTNPIKSKTASRRIMTKDKNVAFYNPFDPIPSNSQVQPLPTTSAQPDIFTLQNYASSVMDAKTA